MGTKKPKPEVVTFKTDGTLLEALKGVPNRSEFIRAAVLAALENHCPLCGGSGVLTPNRLKHWRAFIESHSLSECPDCHELKIVCPATSTRKVHKK